MKTKRPVRIVNPTGNWHTALLFPCQSLIVKLRKPCVFLKASPEAEFDITLFSDFLIIERCEHTEKTGDKVFRISPKYDLTAWVQFGQVLLGNICIRLINNKCNDTENFSSNICVIQNSQSDVLTVVNPVGNTVKMKPHQILEVVCFEPEWNNWVPGMIEAAGFNDTWESSFSSISKSSVSGLQIKEIKYKVVGDRTGVNIEPEPFAAKNRFGLTVNPYLSPAIQNVVKAAREQKPLREHHWWYVCTENTHKKICNLSDDVYDLSYVVLDGKCSTVEENKVFTTARTLEVLLAVHGKRRREMHPFYLNPDSVEYKLEMVKRSEDRMKAVLTNPLSAEHLDFSSVSEEITVEIIQPDMFWDDLDQFARWEFSVDNDPVNPKHVTITKLSDYYRWGKLFQRVKISHDFSTGVGNLESKFLGAVFIKCPQKESCHDAKKRISCWYTPAGEDKKDRAWTNHTTTAVVAKTTTKITSKKKDKDFSGVSRVYDVEFKEIEFQTLEDETTTRNVFEVSHTQKSHCDMSAWCGYSHASYSPTPKKKELPVVQSPKNENSNDSPGCSTERKGDADGGEPCSAFVLYNPEHLTRVVIRQGQSLILRLSRPDKVILNGPPDELWSLSDKPNGDAFKVVYFKTMLVGQSFYQEVKIKQGDISPITGEQSIGSLVFSCSKETRVIFIAVDVENPTAVNNGLKIPDRFRIINARTLGSGNGEKRYLIDWIHNDAVKISPNESFFIRNPGLLSGWETGCWQMQIEQFPLPSEVWRQDDLKEVVKDIDLENLWFKTSTPLQVTNTYVFRPMNIQQPHIETILRAAANATTANLLPIARLTFTNSRHQMNQSVTTPYGVVESVLRLNRSLYLCMSLERYRETVVLEDPAEKTEVVVGNQKILVVKFGIRETEIESGTVECPWFVSSYPPFLDLVNNVVREGNANVFKFKVKPNCEPKTDCIRFICGNKETSLLAKYEKK